MVTEFNSSVKHTVGATFTFLVNVNAKTTLCNCHGILRLGIVDRIQQFLSVIMQYSRT